MPGLGQLFKLAVIFGSVVVDASPKFNNARPRAIEIRAPKPLAQAPAPAAAPAPPAPAAAPPPAPAPAAASPGAPAPAAAPPAAGGLTDTDILQLYVRAALFCQGTLAHSTIAP